MQYANPMQGDASSCSWVSSPALLLRLTSAVVLVGSGVGAAERRVAGHVVGVQATVAYVVVGGGLLNGAQEEESHQGQTQDGQVQVSFGHVELESWACTFVFLYNLLLVN